MYTGCVESFPERELGVSKSKDKRPDQHTSGLLIRLPEWCRPALLALKAKNRRAHTVEILIALENHCKAEGVPVPTEPKK